MTADFLAALNVVPLPLGMEWLPLFRGFVMVLFVMASLILMLVVLIQEGKGGGIAGAFGGAAAETFGVKAGSVNRFTAILAAVFMGLALLHAGLASSTPTSVIAPAAPAPIVPPGVAPQAPPTAPPAAPIPTEAPMDGGTPPAAPAAMDGTTPPATPAAMDGAPPPAGPAAMGEAPPAPAGMDTPPPAPETPAPAGMN